MNEPNPTKVAKFDRVFLNSRREAIVLLVAFSLFLVWTIVVSYVMGYQPPQQTADTIGGIPRWVFYGVGLPWITANVFTIWFAWFYMANDPLGEEDSVSEEQR